MEKTKLAFTERIRRPFRNICIAKERCNPRKLSCLYLWYTICCVSVMIVIPSLLYFGVNWRELQQPPTPEVVDLVPLHDKLRIVWSASLEQHNLINAGFAHETVDFLVPLSKHIYIGWLSTEKADPFTSEDSVIHELMEPDKSIMLMVYQQGHAIKEYTDQILILQFGPEHYDKYFTDQAILKQYKYKIARCMFETTSLPHGWVPILNELMDELWVPSKFSKSVFLKEGIKIPIVIIREGFDPKVYNRDEAVRDHDKFFSKCQDDFVFISSSKWEDRKGFQILFEAFAEEFTEHDKVCLAIRAANLNNHIEEVKNENNARIVSIDRIPMADYPSFYKSADAFVLTSHGEGWGRTVMEAMAMGLPTIVTRWGGLSEFVNPENSININVTLLEPAFTRETGYFGGPEYQDKNWWAKIDKYAVRAALRWVFTNQKEAKELGDRAHDYMHQYYTRDIIAEDVYTRVKEIYYNEVLNFSSIQT